MTFNAIALRTGFFDPDQFVAGGFRARGAIKMIAAAFGRGLTARFSGLVAGVLVIRTD